MLGERRFRHQLVHLSPMKMVKLWAEKEIRNLKRLYASQIPCPRPFFVRYRSPVPISFPYQFRENVLVISFVGQEGFPSPRLRDVKSGDFTKWC